MKRRWKVLIGMAVVLAALLAINTVVINSQTKPAGITAAEGRILDLSSVDLQVVDMPATDPSPRGEGAPIVLLHCYACSLQWWDELVPLINSNHRVVRFDLVGFGGSQKPNSGYTMPEQARAVAEGLNQLGVEGAVLVGHSMGGDVATATAESASQLVDRVAVIGTPSTTEQAELPFIARLSYAPVLGEALWRVRLDSTIRREYGSAFAPGFDFEAAFEDPNQVVEDNRAMTYTSYEKAHEGANDFTDEASIAQRITSAAVPFLAILGAEDQIVDTAATAESFERIPGATVRILEGVGHSANLEAPAETAELLLRFAGAAPNVVPDPPDQQPKSEAQGSAGGDQKGTVDKEAVADALGRGEGDRGKKKSGGKASGKRKKGSAAGRGGKNGRKQKGSNKG